MNRTTTNTIPADRQGRTRVGNKYDIPGDGFIRLAPKTHDISLAGEHIPDIARLAADLQTAVNAGWSRRHEIRYSKVHVLLLKWEDDDLGVETELEDLRHVFSDLFNYGVDVFHIPSEKPDKALKRRVFDFLEHDGEETLLILYYAGHARTSFQANEAPMWIANRQLNSPSLPSGGIQSMFEEADAHVLLLYDCCNSAATAASSSNQRHKGVTEVIAACGYETIAPEVGEHSFSNALAEVLAAASKGKPFSVAELHTKILTRLKCWTPSFVKDDKGKRKEDQAGRLLFERQPRRTPIYSIICETEPRRSIILAPLSLGAKEGEASSSTTAHRTASSSSDPAGPSSPGFLFGSDRHAKKRKRPIDEVIQYPQVLLAIRLDKHELDMEAWKECLLRQLPPEAKDVKIEGIFGSFSTLLLLRVPLEIWDLLPENRAYSFVGYVTTPNMVNEESKRAESVEPIEPNMFEFSQGSSSGKPWGNIPFRPQSRETTPTFALRFTSMSPRDVVISPPLSPQSSSNSSASSTRSLSPVPEAEESEDDNLGISKKSMDFNFTIEEIKDSDIDKLGHHETVWPSSYSDAEESEAITSRGHSPFPSQHFGSKLKSFDIADEEDDSDDEEVEDFARQEFFLKARAAARRAKRASATSGVSKRTLSESIGSDSDIEDMEPGSFLEANQPGSSARRLRRKMGGRTSLVFDDPPERIDEIDEPDSEEGIVDMEDVDFEGGAASDKSKGWGDELPFYMQEDDSLEVEDP
ncbi:hypothetical protein BKA64DRAFT_745783 [Cadophora sp. MPI-SDFR-AT-0126]|nr:hypothetical protein BKA64DRAFT_745783 [Leotiomycetes sp. MPI-SDFR-AT-0126]